MPRCGLMRYYLTFRWVIPQYETDCSRVTHPSATRQSPGFTLRLASFDLHVLSTPPAFVLSQDQTLMFNPQSGVLVQPALQIKTHFRINCRFFSSSLCIVFKILSARCSRALVYNNTPTGKCQHPFFNFFSLFWHNYNFQTFKSFL